MAENVLIGSGNNSTPPDGTIVAADEITVSGSLVNFQRMKIALGEDGVHDSDLDAGQQTSASSLPVVIASDQSAVSTTPAGNVAHDAADSGNPVKVGAIAKSPDGTDPGSVAEDDRSNLVSDLNGRLYVNPAHPNLWHASASFSASTVATSIKAAPGANLALFITDLTVSASGAMNITIIENVSSSVNLIGPLYFADNGGIAQPLRSPIRLSTNTNLGITTGTGATNFSVFMSGYIGAV